MQKNPLKNNDAIVMTTVLFTIHFGAAGQWHREHSTVVLNLLSFI